MQIVKVHKWWLYPCAFLYAAACFGSISNNGITFIESKESFHATPYRCPAGEWTIGYGHLIKKDEKFTTITEPQAESLLIKDLKIFDELIDDCVTVKINQNQRDALISLAMNIGSEAFSDSTLVKKLNDEDYVGAANQFTRWNKIDGKVSKGLTIRRQEEKAMFLKK